MTAMDGVWLVVVTVLMVLLQQYWLSRNINTHNHQRNVVRMSPLLAMLQSGPRDMQMPSAVLVRVAQAGADAASSTRDSAAARRNMGLCMTISLFDSVWAPPWARR